MICLSEMAGGKQRLREISAPRFSRRADVIVCGLGTAGSLAALYAAENGLSVLGIEQFTCVGGVHTAGGVTSHYFGCPGGRYEALDQQVKTFSERYTATEAECRKLLLEQKLTANDVALFYEAKVCGVYLEDNRVIGLRVLTADGIVDCQAKVVMDCTAEASVAAMAGCRTQLGRQSDGQTQPFSVVSMVYNGEKYRYTNVDFGRVDALDAGALSQAILFSRGYAIPEGNNGKRMIAQMPQMGFREGRRIVAEETVTLRELFADRQTDTPMFYSYADLDKHGWDIAFDGETLGDWAVGANLGAYNVTVAVPCKAILPKDYEGMLVPCRALGVDRDISSCVRMLPDMKKLAEVAAQWASLAICQGKSLREVSYAQLAQKLKESGCLNHGDNRGYRIDGRRNWDQSPLVPEDVCWITQPEKLEARLKTEKPGLAIWSARRMGDSAVPTLQKLLDDPDDNTVKHAAFALASLGRADGIAVLREMAVQRDGLLLKDCRKNNNLRGCIAIYWLGRLADRQIAPELMELICGEKELEKPVYHRSELKTTRYDIRDFSGVYFQFISQAVMALVRIGDAHADLRGQIAEAFTRAFSDDAYYYRITQRPRESSEGNMALAVRNIAFSAAGKWEEAAAFPDGIHGNGGLLRRV